MENKQIEELLIKLAEKLGTTVEHLWAVLVRQVYAEAINSSILLILLISAIILFNWVRVTKFPIWEEDFHEHEFKIGAFFISGLGLAIATVVGVLTLIPTIVTNLVNPEYRALRLLFGMVKNIT